MHEIFRGTHNNEIKYFIEPILIRSLRWKHDQDGFCPVHLFYCVLPQLLSFTLSGSGKFLI